MWHRALVHRRDDNIPAFFDGRDPPPHLAISLVVTAWGRAYRFACHCGDAYTVDTVPVLHRVQRLERWAAGHAHHTAPRRRQEGRHHGRR